MGLHCSHMLGRMCPQQGLCLQRVNSASMHLVKKAQSTRPLLAVPPFSQHHTCLPCSQPGLCVQCIVYASKIQALPDLAILQSLLEAHQAICSQTPGDACVPQDPGFRCQADGFGVRLVPVAQCLCMLCVPSIAISQGSLTVCRSKDAKGLCVRGCPVTSSISW